MVEVRGAGAGAAGVACARGASADSCASSTQRYLRELNRFGITSVCDPGGGGQQFDEHYAIIRNLARTAKLTVRCAYYIFAQVKGREVADFARFIKLVAPGADAADCHGHGRFLACCGAGEIDETTGDGACCAAACRARRDRRTERAWQAEQNRDDADRGAVGATPAIDDGNPRTAPLCSSIISRKCSSEQTLISDALLLAKSV